MPQITCQHCGSQRHYPASVLARIAGKYCSKKCEGAARSLRVEIACSHCGTLFTRRRDKALPNSTCGVECAGHMRRHPGPWSLSPDVSARRAYFRSYAESRRDEINAASAAWAKAHRPYRNMIQQLRRAGGSITLDQWSAILEQHGNACAGCGGTERLEMDHIVPVIRGGLTVAENLQPLCRYCNASKGARPMEALNGFPIVEV